MQHDLKETLEAVSDIANSDESLKSICLSDRHAKLMAGVAAATLPRSHRSASSFDGFIKITDEKKMAAIKSNIKNPDVRIQASHARFCYRARAPPPAEARRSLGRPLPSPCRAAAHPGA